MNRILQLRKEKGLSQTSLAMRLNTTQYMISAYEHGRHQPSIEMLIALASFFGVSVDYLIGYSDIRLSECVGLDKLLSEDEKKLLNHFSVLSQSQKKIALGVVFSLKDYTE